MLEKNPETLKIVYKNFPLNSHRFSATAALAAFAAQKQGKFWQYHDLIFEKFNNLSNALFTEFAQKLELNMPQFQRDMNSQEAKDYVTRDYQNGAAAGVAGTPALFINGRQLRDRSNEGIQKIIAETLQK